MFAHAQDDSALYLVAMMLGPTASEQDYEQLVGTVHRFADLTLARRETKALVLVYVETKGPPATRHRKSIAAAADRIPSHRFAFVSPSTIARGVNMAISLLAPAGPGTVRSTHASIDDALMWFETQQPGSSVALRRLADAALASAR